jgi:hypothetical protein
MRRPRPTRGLSPQENKKFNDSVLNIHVSVYVKLRRRGDNVELQIDRRDGTAFKHRIE